MSLIDIPLFVFNSTTFHFQISPKPNTCTNSCTFCIIAIPLFIAKLLEYTFSPPRNPSSSRARKLPPRGDARSRAHSSTLRGNMIMRERGSVHVGVRSRVCSCVTIRGTAGCLEEERPRDLPPSGGPRCGPPSLLFPYAAAFASQPTLSSLPLPVFLRRTRTDRLVSTRNLGRH